MLYVVDSHIQMFADDTKLDCEVNNKQQTESLQQDIPALENWIETWQLNFNAEKCSDATRPSQRQAQLPYY